VKVQMSLKDVVQSVVTGNSAFSSEKLIVY